MLWSVPCKRESNRLNTAATSNQQIITGLENAAAAMSITGTSFEQAVALFTAGQEITQDASKMGRELPKCLVTSIKKHGKSVKIQRWSRPRITEMWFVTTGATLMAT